MANQLISVALMAQRPSTCFKLGRCLCLITLRVDELMKAFDELFKNTIAATKIACAKARQTIVADGAKSIFTGPKTLDEFVNMYVPDRLNDGAGASHAQTA